MPDRIAADHHSAAFNADPYFTSLARSITDYVICALDAHGRIASWNPAAENILGYRSEDVLGQPFVYFYTGEQTSFEEQNLSPPNDDQALQDLMQRALTDGTAETSLWCRCKDDSRFQAQVTMSVADQGGKAAPGFVMTVKNVSESIVVKQALFESEQRFRVLVEGVRDYAIYMLDPDGYVTNWNSGAALIKGYEKDDIIGRHFSCFYTAEDQARGAPQRSLEIALKHNTFQSEAWRVRKDGTEFWASVVIDPVFDANGTLLGYAKVTRDITEQKQAQEQFAQQREIQHQSQKLEALGRLTGSVAHDFNNLLAIIRTATEMLQSSSSLTAEKRSRYSRMILDTTDRAGKLIDQLLSFSRRQPMARQVFDINARICEFKSIIETTLGSRLTLNMSFSEDLEPVETDPNQFETAVLNMIINAHDATPKGGAVTISGCTTTLDWVCADGKIEKRRFTALSVADTGAGIDPSVLPNIFEPFFTTKDIDKGTGLGLSQVYGFAKQSGGDVVVQSERGKGTCFTLYLPCASGASQEWAGVLSPLAQRMFEED